LQVPPLWSGVFRVITSPTPFNRCQPAKWRYRNSAYIRPRYTASADRFRSPPTTLLMGINSDSRNTAVIGTAELSFQKQDGIIYRPIAISGDVLLLFADCNTVKNDSRVYSQTFLRRRGGGVSHPYWGGVWGGAHPLLGKFWDFFT